MLISISVAMLRIYEFGHRWLPNIIMGLFTLIEPLAPLDKWISVSESRFGCCCREEKITVHLILLK
jgi:hypothetical protein